MKTHRNPQMTFEICCHSIVSHKHDTTVEQTPHYSKTSGRELTCDVHCPGQREDERSVQFLTLVGQQHHGLRFAEHPRQLRLHLRTSQPHDHPQSCALNTERKAFVISDLLVVLVFDLQDEQTTTNQSSGRSRKT